MLNTAKRILFKTPLKLIHLLGGTGAAVLAFLLTFHGHSTWVALPIMFICLVPDSLYSAAFIIDWRTGRLSMPELVAKLKTIWFMMACACVAVLFATWLGSHWAILNSALAAN